MSVVITEDDFDVGAEHNKLKSVSVGAIVTFTGTVRDFGSGEAIAAMTLEHYPGMTEKSIAKILDRVASSWSLEGVQVVHRIGKLKPEDQIVLVMVAASHRSEAFQAASMVMDFLKTEAEFWKKETGDLGTRWIQSTDQDLKRRESWEYNSE